MLRAVHNLVCINSNQKYWRLLAVRWWLRWEGKLLKQVLFFFFFFFYFKCRCVAYDYVSLLYDGRNRYLHHQVVDQLKIPNGLLHVNKKVIEEGGWQDAIKQEIVFDE